MDLVMNAPAKKKNQDSIYEALNLHPPLDRILVNSPYWPCGYRLVYTLPAPEDIGGAEGAYEVVWFLCGTLLRLV